ncbi:sensor histidine kinase [Microvirga pudoricolor]|uniref:sensor histidine kinase n=1 Tax=Microvirga pudoricolor TaxID=2778729 RepID=UPI00194FE156|nr:HWE histidine kinase domain-containing protein [Microvirga pudoricolor]MBM6592396.1 PAS domain-containing protein [Microvirga pudoricolor]
MTASQTLPAAFDPLGLAEALRAAGKAAVPPGSSSDAGPRLGADPRLGQLLDGMGEAFFALDTDWRVAAVNARAEDVLRRPRDTMLGRPIWEILPGGAEAELRACCETVLATGRAAACEVAPDGIMVHLFVFGDGVGARFPDRAPGREAEAELRESQARLAALADNLTLGMVYQISDSPGRDGREMLYLSGSCEQLIGIPAEEARRDPRRIYELVLPEYRALMPIREREAFEARKPFDMEIAIRHAITREIRWHRLVVTPRQGADGRWIWDGLQVDITQQKRAEEHQRLLANELNHRVKNTLSIVQSLAQQSFRDLGDAPLARDAKIAFENRILALARGHDVLTQESWDSASLDDIVAQAIAPYRDLGGGSAFRVEGESLRVSPAMTLGFSMALHELCTNTVKYGALSRPGGQVRLAWARHDRDGGAALVLTWEERGGPIVTPPGRRGFGTRLMERILTRELNGTLRLAYPPAGVACTLEVPLGP